MSTQYRRPIAIAVAPVGTNITAPSQNPLTPEEVAQEVIACAQDGASMVHLHVRDKAGRQTEQLADFSRTLDLIREASDIIIQGSTGGVTTLTREERCVSLDDARVEVASLNMGSANVGETVYVNTLGDIRFWGQRMRERHIVPELEVFEGGMLTNIPRLLEEDVLAPPFHVNFVLGFEGPLPASPTSLFFLKSMLPPDLLWGTIHDGMQDLTLLATAIGLGASVVRVGFEDSVYSAPGEAACTNVELVTKIVDMIHALGCRVATPTETRAMFGIHA
jgi:3-keto-5-aminohexanoate cleavage enzyme